MAPLQCARRTEVCGRASLIVLALLAWSAQEASGAEVAVSAAGDVEDVTASSAESCATGSAAPKLFEWFRAAGGTVEGVELRETPATGRGLVAAKDLEEGTKVLMVPVELTVTMQRSAATPLGMKLLDAAAEGRAPDMKSFDGVLLAAWILHETAQADSSWSTYLDSLPVSVTTPFNFTHEEVQSCLGGLDAVDYIPRGKRLLEKELALLQSLPEAESADVSHKRWLWARFMSFSRTFTVDRQRVNMDSTMNGVPELPAFTKKLWAESEAANEAALLVPLADMLNHATNHNCDWRYSGRKGFTVTTRRPLKAGEELLINYGTKENQLFLAHYGFIEPGTPGDKWNLVLRLSELNAADAQSTDPAHECEQKGGLEQVTADVTLRIDAGNPSSPDELHELLNAGRTRAQELGFGESSCLEAAALRLLSAALKREEQVFEASADCPDICKAYRQNLRELLGTWRVFAERAAALVTGIDPPDAAWLKVPRFVRHARLYFGLWMNTHGGLKLAKRKDDLPQAKVYGKMSFFDAVYGDDQ